MLGQFILAFLATITSSMASDSDLFVLSHRTPRYFQANFTFAQAKQYFQRNLPYGNMANITEANIAFGILCGITGRLVQDSIVNQQIYDPRAVIHQYAIYARQQYDEIARSTNELLQEASRKATPVTELLNSLCTPSNFPDCNERMESRVINDPYTYRMPAKLFIHIGKLAKNIMRNKILIERLINNDEVVQYLSQHVKDDSIEKLIKKMERTYTILKMSGTVYV